MKLFFILSLGGLNCFYLKNVRENKYLCLKTKHAEDSLHKLTYLKLSEKIKNAVELDLKHMKDGVVYILLAGKKNKTFDIENHDKLNMYPYHGGDNQQFELLMIRPNQFVMKTMDRCIEYFPESGYLRLSPCRYTKEQLFELVQENKLPQNINARERKAFLEDGMKNDRYDNYLYENEPDEFEFDQDFDDSHALHEVEDEHSHHHRKNHCYLEE